MLLQNKINLSTIKNNLIYLLAFTIPLSKIIVPYIIVTIMLVLIIERIKDKSFSQFKNRYFFFSISLYFLHVIGIFYTKDMDAGAFNLTQKLSLLIFPLVFFSYEFFPEQFNKNIQRNFIIGAVFACIICFANASLHFYFSQNIEHFFYVDFSALMHPSYFAMYIAFSSAFLFFNNSLINFKPLAIIIQFVFILSIILLSSKSGFITEALIIFSKLMYGTFVKRKFLKSLGLAFLFISILFSFFLLVPKSLDRINLMFNSLGSESTEFNSTNGRIAVWKSSIKIIKNNILFGVGTGDANNELQIQYKKEDQTELIEKKLNSHNQYLQTQLMFGILGTFSLLLVMGLTAFYCLKTNEFIGLIFVLITILNFLFESMLETQAGVVFISFFLFYYLRKTTQKNHSI